MLLGLYTRILDTRNILPLPVEFSEAFKDGAFVTQGFDRNLMVLTRGAFEQIYQRVMASNLADPLARMLMRMLLGTAQEIELDPDGSIPIGKPLRDFALLAQDAILVGLGDYLEIWSPEQWNKQEEQITNVEANPDRFSSLVVTTR